MHNAYINNILLASIPRLGRVQSYLIFLPVSICFILAIKKLSKIRLLYCKKYCYQVHFRFYLLHYHIDILNQIFLGGMSVEVRTKPINGFQTEKQCLLNWKVLKAAAALDCAPVNVSHLATALASIPSLAVPQ